MNTLNTGLPDSFVKGRRRSTAGPSRKPPPLLLLRLLLSKVLDEVYIQPSKPQAQASIEIMPGVNVDETR